MKRSDWHYGADWYETWMAWEDLNEFPEWPLDIIAATLADYLRNTAGWEVDILDWTTAAAAADADVAPQQGHDEPAAGGAGGAGDAGGAGPAHVPPL